MKLKHSYSAGFVLAMSILAACGGGGGQPGSSTPPISQMGTLKVGLTDAPGCGFDAVNVTITKVRVHQSASASDTDAGWTDLTLATPKRVDLLKLTNGALEALGQTPLTVGHYSQLRLVLAANGGSTPLANSVVPTGGSEVALDTPSAVQSGIKLIHEFDVAAGNLVDLTLDFDACQSVVKRGNSGYLMKPVVTVVPTIVSGGIAGYVDPAMAATHPLVTAQINGKVVKATVPDATGAYRLSPLVQSSTAGKYTVVLSTTGYTTAAVTDVPVTAGADTTIGTQVVPLKTAVSVMRTASGTTAPLNVGASVSASQTLTNGSSITVASANADATSGTYSLSLPVEAPTAAPYATLALSFVPQLTAAGKYTLAASATGLTAAPVNVDVGTANVTQDFTLK